MNESAADKFVLWVGWILIGESYHIWSHTAIKDAYLILQLSIWRRQSDVPSPGSERPTRTNSFHCISIPMLVKPKGVTPWNNRRLGFAPLCFSCVEVFEELIVVFTPAPIGNRNSGGFPLFSANLNPWGLVAKLLNFGEKFYCILFRQSMYPTMFPVCRFRKCCYGVNSSTS